MGQASEMSGTWSCPPGIAPALVRESAVTNEICRDERTTLEPASPRSDRPPLSSDQPHCLNEQLFPANRMSVQIRQSINGSALNAPITVCRGDGVRPTEKVACISGVSRSLALGEHLPQPEVRPSPEALRADACIEPRSLSKVAERLVVTTEDAGKTPEVQAHRTESGYGGQAQLVGPRGESFEQRAGILAIAAFDSRRRVIGHRGQRRSVLRKFESPQDEFLYELARLVCAIRVRERQSQCRFVDVRDAAAICDQLFDEWDQLAKCPSLKVDHRDL